MVHLQELIETPKVQANLLELAKSKLIENLKSQIKSIDKKILHGEEYFEENNFLTEDLYKISYAHLYTLKYERDWLVKQLEKELK